ncbi:MAG: shikimate dehydrogenase family protein [bacterium]
MNKLFPTTGTLNKFSLIYIWGEPLDYTLSPFFQEHSLSFYRQRVVYKVFRGEESEFKRLLLSKKCVGANVTMPHKQAALQICDAISNTASVSGSVNTIYKREGKLIGDNTDGDGMAKWLKFKGKNIEKVCILGNGGSAMAISAALFNESSSLVIFGREEKGWEKSFGIFKNITDFSEKGVTINTLPFKVVGKNIVNISYSFGEISEDAAGMLAFQGFLSAKRWFPLVKMEEQHFLKAAFLHRKSALNSFLALQFAGVKNEI